MAKKRATKQPDQKQLAQKQLAQKQLAQKQLIRKLSIRKLSAEERLERKLFNEFSELAQYRPDAPAESKYVFRIGTKYFYSADTRELFEKFREVRMSRTE